MKNAIPLLSAFAIIISTQSSLFALEKASPESVGMSSAKLARIDEIMIQSVEDDFFPGGVVMIVKDGKIVFQNSYGESSLNNHQKFQLDDIFRIASMTKAITTVAVMQLYEKGYFLLDDPIHKFIPAFKSMRVLNSFDEESGQYTTVAAESDITIRQLLTHTSGLVYGDFESGAIHHAYKKHHLLQCGLSHDEWDSEEFINRLAKAPLNFQPGERYQYGLSMDVLGRLVEVVSGKSYAQYLQESIFNPLKMNDTAFYQPKSKHNRIVPVQILEANKWIMASDSDEGFRADYPKKADNGHYAGGGGLSSTALDYARFCQALVQYGELEGARILSRKSIETMTSDQMVALNREGMGFSQIPGQTYCLGFSLTTTDAHSLRSAGTYEWGGYFNTKFIIDPKENLVFVGMGQVTGRGLWNLWEKLISVTYSAIED